MTSVLSVSSFPTWKDKILDYEIETLAVVNSALVRTFLEKIRFSITRLKRKGHQGFRVRVQPPWKDKILDYEIETQTRHHFRHNLRDLKR